MATKKAMYPFYKSNIHERRWAAYVARSLPMLSLIICCTLLAVGVVRSTPLLLWVTAVLNVSMWLWIVATSTHGIIGSFTVQDQLRRSEAEDFGPLSVSDDSTTESQDDVRHVIVIPNYKEDEDMLAETLESLKEARGSEKFFVMLAMEAREMESRQKAESLQELHGRSFAELAVAFHPTDLKEIHVDGSYNAEVPGKASNLKYAVAEAHKAVSEDPRFSVLDSVVLTVADADVLFHPSYFAHISRDFKKLRQEGKDQQKWTMWQSPQLPWRNFYESPIVSRTWGYISSMYEFGGVSSLTMGGHHMVFSAYSVPLQLACNAELWDGDVIAEDHHSYLKVFFYSAYQSQLQVAQDGTGSISSHVQVRPVMLPSKSTSVNSGDGYWATWIERWHQATRHTQGVAEMSYAFLAAWDLLCSVPVSSLSPSFVLYLPGPAGNRFSGADCVLVFEQLPCADVPKQAGVMNLQYAEGGTLLCGLAGAWVLTWPVAIPFTLLMVANYLFIRVAFIQPAEAPAAKAGKRSLWHAADGGFSPSMGSSHAAAMMLITVDCIVFLGPIMAVYGALAAVLSYWNVMVRGNHFKYITASKSLGTDYGAVGKAEVIQVS
eukprot:CAMPEP_0115141342 /NCGR_PEP_ID=MMETSP0227-20121206/59478_1 /TAXON_ID=89957 /ORGANISM="Polarella glacialis, Strain CCMP 1383" /LENGTH=603 /DNA_ID=CAMNT_0002549681 /DNA_START=73 /DNA_END=1885 /DNA_ORIENTATION=+